LPPPYLASTLLPSQNLFENMTIPPPEEEEE